MRGHAAWLGLAALALAGPAAAQAVDVWGGGLASACSAAAQGGSSSIRDERVCTQSLETEQLIPLDRAGTYVNRGIIKLHAKRYAEALADFNAAIRYKADLAEAYVNRAAARIGLRQFKDSVSDIDNALILNVKEPEKAYYNRAVAYEYLDDEKDAWLDYNKALQLAPDWPLVKQQLARFTVSHPLDALPTVASPTPEAKPQP